MADHIFIKRVKLNNYKSIKSCDVELGPLTFLVGPNGAGKSNFLDALHFVSESLNNPLEYALRERGGINEVRRRSFGKPTKFGIKIHWELPSNVHGIYGFLVKPQAQGGFIVQQEICRVFDRLKVQQDFYSIDSGKIETSIENAPQISPDRLYLATASNLPAFRPLFDALTHMGFYNLNPDTIRELQPSDANLVLKRDGSNLASVLNTLRRENRPLFLRLIEFLSVITPGIKDIKTKRFQTKETLEFSQFVGNDGGKTTPFTAENMSDGTLRALGILTALVQSPHSNGNKVRFVGIEEPETAVHPGAAAVLRDALREATQSTQILVTSHSPDLLDDKSITDRNILAVSNNNGETIIGPIDDASKSSLKKRLYTAGELLRSNLLTPENMDSNGDRAEQTKFDLFAAYSS
ncbi:hypothetical protein AUK40_02660 [Candidatus Wirthbacteria bacterium CG2_30_54_11]|uniref:ATPase AAA-type core domain-containing protein n=1 Tax=Candidatus Wirthbacteria bacterium CG2_30_54_11 TaxID=1817892 RepID=A0A1J5IZP3_9BACT|nr:MAG: hypothetical protein AUK40_02660 [Candidatus Wirthbacteria bacterium CG2_30_54_11]